jgi:thioesterase domain-containing protein
MSDKPLSQPEAYKVARWLKQSGKEVEAVLIDLWRKSPSEIAKEYDVDKQEVMKAAGRNSIR